MLDKITLYKDKNITITGASGYIASALANILKEKCANIIRVSRKDLPLIQGTQPLIADISSKKCWYEIIENSDIVFHLAGNTSVYYAEEDPVGSLYSTLLPITNLINVAQETGLKPNVVYASTATIYGLTNNLPVSESKTPNPITNYDLHKLFAEKQLEMASKKEIINAISLRLGNVYGPSLSFSSSDDRGVLNKIVNMAIHGDDLKLYGDGNYLRDYVYIDDVVKAFIYTAFANTTKDRSFNVASGIGITIAEVFEVVKKKVFDVTGKSIRIEKIAWPENTDPIEYRNFVANIDSIKKTFNWTPEINLEDGINRLINSIK